jgi:hypothetical protein
MDTDQLLQVFTRVLEVWIGDSLAIGEGFAVKDRGQSFDFLPGRIAKAQHELHPTIERW